MKIGLLKELIKDLPDHADLSSFSPTTITVVVRHPTDPQALPELVKLKKARSP